MLENVVVVLGIREVAAKLDCSKVTLGRVVKVVVYVAGCPPTFGLVCFDAGFGDSLLMVLPDLRIIRQV